MDKLRYGGMDKRQGFYLMQSLIKIANQTGPFHWIHRIVYGPLKSPKTSPYETLCATWYQLCNLKKGKHAWRSVTFNKDAGFSLELY